jgi:Zn-dependent M28 family amino/carboxypeptidase
MPVPDPVAVRVGTVDRAALEAALEAVPLGIRARAEQLEVLFQQAGCGAHTHREMPGGTPEANVWCELPGRSDATLVVGANLDRANDGIGAVDNWSGIALLPSLYQAIAVEPREHSYVFAGFAHAKLHQRGSRQFLRRMGPEERAKIVGMVDLKGLGIGTTAIWTTQADRNLRQDLFAVTKALGLPLRETRFFSNVSVDSQSFRFYGIPTLTVHSFDRRSARVLAQPVLDRSPDRIDRDAYYETARTLAVYLAYLDDTLRIRAERGEQEDEF